MVEILQNGQANWNMDYHDLYDNSFGGFSEWSGNFRSILDRPHFQTTFGYDYRQLDQMIENGQVDENGYIKFDFSN